MPFFSTDGEWVGFVANGALRKVSLDGRPSVTLLELPAVRHGASWGPDNVIVYTYAGASGLWRVPASGGDPEPVSSSEDERTGDLRWPDVLPDGSAALVTVWTSNLANAQIGVVSLATGALEILADGTFPRYSETGHVVFWRDGGLWAVRFDAARRHITEPAAPVIDGVGVNPGGIAHVDLAAGTLAYLPAWTVAGGIPTWVDRDGRAEPVGAPRGYSASRISADGRRVALASLGDDADLQTFDLARRTVQEVTGAPGEESNPVWIPDGTRLVFSADGYDGGQGLFWKAADGTGSAERLSTGIHFPSDVTPDGGRLLYTDFAGAGGGDIGWLSLEGEPSPERLLATPLGEGQGMVSPKGCWIAYVGDDGSGDPDKQEIFVSAFPDITGRTQMSRGGGTEPLWGRDGQDLFYRTGTRVMRVAVADGPPHTWGTPTVLFDRATAGFPLIPGRRTYDVARDGRFLMISNEEVGPDRGSGVIVVENWSTELNELVPPN